MQRILIVDDDDSLRKLYEDEFREQGYSVSSVATGQEGMDRIRSSPPDAVILDIRLGETNGLDVLRAVLLEHPDIAVVLNSAYSGYKQHFASWSADGYVVKSSDLTELKTAVVNALQHRSRAAA